MSQVTDVAGWHHGKKTRGEGGAHLTIKATTAMRVKIDTAAMMKLVTT